MTFEKLQMTQTSDHERELVITVPTEVVTKEFDQALNKLQRVAKRPGFRPGKMPKPMVLSFYKNEIQKNLMDTLIEKSFEPACKEKDIIPVSQPKMEPVGSFDQSKAFTYKAIFQVKPKVETPTFMGLDITLKKFGFDENDVNDELNNLREHLATFKSVERTVIAATDVVECDSEVKVEGVLNPQFSHKDYSVPLFAENVPADLRQALVGKSVGETASVMYDMPADHQDEVIKGKKCEMILTIKSFKERVLPELNDDFAKDLSEKFKTLEEVKESVRLRFTITSKRRNDYYRQDAITKALIEKNPLDVPPALTERMSMSLLNRELEAMGEKEASEMVKNHWQYLWDSVQERAVTRVKAELLFESLIKSLNISASDEEVASRTKKLKDANREDVTYSIQVEKLLDLMEKEGNITTVEEPIYQKG